MKARNLLLALALLPTPTDAREFQPPEPVPSFELCPFEEADSNRALVTDLRIARVRQDDDRTILRVRGRARRGRRAPDAKLLLQVCLRGGAEVIGSTSETVLKLRPRFQKFDTRFAIEGSRPGQQAQILVRAIAVSGEGRYDTGDVEAHQAVWRGILGGPQVDAEAPGDEPALCASTGEYDYAAQGLRATLLEDRVYLVQADIRNVGDTAGSEGSATFSYITGGRRTIFSPEGGPRVAPLSCGESRTYQAILDLRGVDLTEEVILRYWITPGDSNPENDRTSIRLDAGSTGDDAPDVPTEVALTEVTPALFGHLLNIPDQEFNAPEGERRFELTVGITGQQTGTPREVILVLVDGSTGLAFGETVVQPVGGSFTVNQAREVPGELACGDTFEGRVDAYISGTDSQEPAASREFSATALCLGGSVD